MSLLLGTDTSRVKLNELLSKNENGVILSAFFSDAAGEWLDSFQLPSSTIVIRGQYLDFSSGVTSIRALRKLSENEHSVKLKLDLHAKLFWFGEEMLVGSSNLTGNGFNLLDNGGNIELNAVVPATEDNVTVVKNIVSSSVELNTDLINKMENLLEHKSLGSLSVSGEWPSELFSENNAGLYVSDLPQLDFHKCSLHDLGMWGDISRKQLSGNSAAAQSNLESTKIFSWLVSKLEKNDKSGLRFGSFSSLLHEELIVDPALFRREVKDLQRYLYSFLDQIPSRIDLSVPGAKSQVLRLYQKQD